MTSVVIPAHNEESVIGRCLDALLDVDGSSPGDPDVISDLDVTVVANGCADATAVVAASRAGVRVLDLATASKAGALNAGDAVAVGFPRVYLDADVVVPRRALETLVAALGRDPDGAGAPWLAVVPRRAFDLAGRPPLVRAYYAINSRLPVFRDGLFGRGAIALSAAGRARFDTFPDLVADDLFLDSLFTGEEKATVASVASTVSTPTRSRDLVRRLARVRAGNLQLRAAAARGVVPPGVRRADSASWLRDVVLPRPWLAPAAVGYVGLVLAAEFTARRATRAGALGWGRDDSSRASSTGAE